MKPLHLTPFSFAVLPAILLVAKLGAKAASIPPPSGPPVGVHVEAIDETTLKVTWKPPEQDGNENIRGYYVGYKHSSSVERPFLFEIVNLNRKKQEELLLIIKDLKTNTQYSVVVQAFNKGGVSPLSEEVKQFTREGTPEEAPNKTTCTALTSQTIRVSWMEPNASTANGVIQGYKVIYGPSETWNNLTARDSKVANAKATNTIIDRLLKYTNYSMQVLAFTAGGDGVRSDPIQCRTNEDVPEAPAAIKALVMSPRSIFVSWQPPSQPNGAITQYTVYFKEEKDSGEPQSQRIKPSETSYEASGLKENGKYEFWVTASTNTGEGPKSKTLSVTLSSEFPARIGSFDGNLTSKYLQDVTLPCFVVGLPVPDVAWKVNGVILAPSACTQQLANGSLLIKSASKTDTGEYTCSVENKFGKDSVTHQLVTLTPPNKPQVAFTLPTTTSITLKLEPNPQDTEPLHGYTIRFKPDFGELETVEVGPNIHSYTLENLFCGTQYTITVAAHNSLGTGESDVYSIATNGSKPISPDASKFLIASAERLRLHLRAWSDGGCPIICFVIESKKKSQRSWNLVSNCARHGGDFIILDLEPGTRYSLRVTSRNMAGSTAAEYEFTTLAADGSKLNFVAVTTIRPAHQLGGM